MGAFVIGWFNPINFLKPAPASIDVTLRVSAAGPILKNELDIISY